MKTNDQTKTNNVNNIEFFESNPFTFNYTFGAVKRELIEMDGKMWLCGPIVADMKREDGSTVEPFRYICYVGEAGEVKKVVENGEVKIYSNYITSFSKAGINGICIGKAEDEVEAKEEVKEEAEVEVEVKEEAKIVVAFHIGRGGHYHNAGHKTFLGKLDIYDLISKNSDDLFEENRDSKGRFCPKYWSDGNSTPVLDSRDIDADGCGVLDFDGEYDTDYCKVIDDCDDDELQLIIDAVVDGVINDYDIEDWLERNSIEVVHS